MADIANGRVFRAYDELGKMLEKVPGGMTFDQAISKLPSLRNLKKKEADSLLNLIKSKDRIDVMETTQKGESGSPMLRHRMHTQNSILSSVPEQTQMKVELPHSGRTVYISKPGRLTLDPKMVAAMKQDSMVDTAATRWPVTDLLEQRAVELNTTAEGAAAHHMANARLGGKLDVVVEDILKFLEKRQNGANRTDINNKVMSYHAARGSDRAVVIAHLIACHGVVEQVPTGGDARAAKILMHPKFIKKLDVSAQRFDHDAPTLSLDPIIPNYIPDASAKVHIAPKAPTPRQDVTLEEVMEIADKVYSAVIVAWVGGMAFARLHDMVKEYHDLSENDRSRVISYLVDCGMVFTFRKGQNQVWFIERTAPKEQAVKETTTVSAPAVATPKLEEPKQEELTMTAAPIVLSPEELRRQAAVLNAQAEELERRKNDQALMERVLPLRTAIVQEFQNAQAAINLQIDAMAALGLAIEQLNQVLLEEPNAGN